MPAKNKSDVQPEPSKRWDILNFFQILRDLWLLMRHLVFPATLLVLLAVGLLSIWIKYWAETNLLCVFLAYCPAWVTILPLAGTAVMGLAFLCWRSACLSAVSVGGLLLWLGGYSFARQETAVGDKVLRVVSYNRGSGSHTLLQSFAEEVSPDVVLLQDSGRRLPQILQMPSFQRHEHHSQNGEYIILSRWPVLKSELLELPWAETSSKVHPVGVRSEVDWGGHLVVVYNLHMPTPRDLLSWYGSHGTFLYGILGLVPGTRLHDRHHLYLETWRSRVELLARVLDRVRTESAPVVLVGDLNFPAAGQAYQLLREGLIEAHQTGGGGFGHTFPGNASARWQRLAPWIRIDHAFVSKHWNVVSAVVGKKGRSQHLPTAVVLQLRDN